MDKPVNTTCCTIWRSFLVTTLALFFSTFLISVRVPLKIQVPCAVVALSSKRDAILTRVVCYKILVTTKGHMGALRSLTVCCYPTAHFVAWARQMGWFIYVKLEPNPARP